MAERAPKRIRARSRGRVTSTLEVYAERYRERFPERDCRWVYDPTHRPELSNVMSREADGYERVTLGDLGMDENPEQSGKLVRVSDLILMGIDKELRMELAQERDQLARDQREMIQREFYDSTEKSAAAAHKEGHARPPSRPIGSVSIEEKEFEYDVEQRQGDTQ